MSTPPGLVGAALVFWGWQAELLPVAAVLAALLEGSRLVGWRWELSRADLHRIADLCRVVLVGMVAYLLATRQGPMAMWGIVRWYPLAVFPLVACQAYGAGTRIDLWTSLLLVRRRDAGEPEASRRAINLAYPYVVLCVLSASAANVRTAAFYLAACGLTAWALWSWRSPRVPALVWAGLVVVVGVLGYGGHIGLHGLQRVLVGTVTEWFFADMLETDPYRTSTAIGYIGDLKLSDRIVLRVEPGTAVRPPMLLREASYSIYSGSIWFAASPLFTRVRPEADGTTWRLHPGTVPRRSATVSAYLRRGKGVLALPNGAVQIERLHVLRTDRNDVGAVKVDEGLGLITYRIRFDPGDPREEPPGAVDLRLPAAEAAVVTRIAAELRLSALPPRERLAAVAAHFREHFGYSTYLGRRPFGGTALEDFLLRTRAGHCEYFATATVLLLRAAGIPARYAVGYAVREFSELEGMYVARARHAHSWTLAYVDGVWRDLDTTPATWFGVEQAAASGWEPLYDLWARAVFLFSRWRWSEESGGIVWYVAWLLLPLTGFLVWRLRFIRRRAGSAAAPESLGEPAHAGSGRDSEFYRIERRLAELGLARHGWEPLTRWIRRIEAARPESMAADALSAIVALHYRYRFDPRGLSSTEREVLRSDVARWLAQHGG